MRNDIAYCIQQLEDHIKLFKPLLETADETYMSWKPTEDRWSFIEIIGHLIDEECLDFRFRTQWVLEQPGETPPPIDPLSWVKEHKYIEQDYHQQRERFFRERMNSLQWLNSLGDVNWDACYEHPKKGDLSAAFFLKNWVAHDILHMRQLVKLKLDYLDSKNDDPIDYAGIW